MVPPAYMFDWDNLMRHGDLKVKLANESFAKLIKATPEEIACQPNTSRGLATITASIGIKRGENVIVNELELGEHLSLDPTQKGG